MTTEPFVAPSIYKSADLKIVKIYVRRIITFEAPPPSPPKKEEEEKKQVQIRQTQLRTNIVLKQLFVMFL